MNRQFVRAGVVSALGALVLFPVSPAFAADYTLDCTATQGAPFVDGDASDAYYGIQTVEFDGTASVTLTVTITNCNFHLAQDSTGYFENPYVGDTTTTTYTLTIPVDGNGQARGYNTGFGSPTNTAFILDFTNPAPVLPPDDGGDGGDGGDGESGGGTDNTPSDSHRTTTAELASTGVGGNIVTLGGFAALAALTGTLFVAWARRRHA